MVEASGDLTKVQQQEIVLPPETIRVGIKQLFDMFNQLKGQSECDLTDDGGFAAVATGVKSRVECTKPSSTSPYFSQGTIQNGNEDLTKSMIYYHMC